MQKLDNIAYLGVETNNLKDIDVYLIKNAINLIVGPSGSGKTSLAYDTISQISQHELLSMYADEVNDPNFKVRSYENIITAVPIRQLNHNNNPRSTIGSYTGLARDIIVLYSYINNIAEDSLSLRKEENVCEYCHGAGVVNVPDIHKIISPNKAIKDNPFRCWQRRKDFYQKILKRVCRDYDIDDTKTFFELDSKSQDFLLSGESQRKYNIQFNKNSSASSRTTKYYGLLTNQPMLINFKIASSFFSKEVCPHCQGKRFAKHLDSVKIKDLSIGDFFCLNFKELSPFVDSLLKGAKFKPLRLGLTKIKVFIDRALDLNLGHLHFNRSIPSLSGGELQRLRMILVFNTSLSNLLLVLDEPLAGLSYLEQELVLQKIKSFIPRNTVLIVDHSNAFVKEAKHTIALGPSGGANGGYLIDPKEYYQQDIFQTNFTARKIKKVLHFESINNIYSYHGVRLTVLEQGLNLIYGASGIGKSTLLREYLPQINDKYQYINQKSLVGNKNSSLCTALGLFTNITKLFADKYDKSYDFFSNQSSCTGACSNCQGAGYLEYNISGDNFSRVQCHECQGTGFTKNLMKYKLNDKNIFDIWHMTVDEAQEFFVMLDDKIAKKLQAASALMLGHLVLGQATSSLSGGENVRVKLLKAHDSTAKIIGFDEPFKGLNRQEISKVLNYLHMLRESGKTIIVVDHTQGISEVFDKKIELTVSSSGILTEVK